MKKIIFLCQLIFLLVSTNSYSEMVSQEEITARLIEMHIGRSEDINTINDRLLNTPDEENQQIVHGIIVFNQPLKSTELIQMEQEYHLDILELRHEMSIANTSLARSGEFKGFKTYQGSTGEKIEFFTEQYLRSLDKSIQAFEKILNQSLQTQSRLNKNAGYKILLNKVQEVGLDYYQLEVISRIEKLKRMLNIETNISFIKFSRQSPWLIQNSNTPINIRPLKFNDIFDSRHQIQNSSQLEAEPLATATAPLPFYLRCPFANENNCPPDATWVPEF